MEAKDKVTQVVIKGIIIKGDKILTIRRSLNDKIGAGDFEVVGGKLEFGEDTLTALKREVKEETDIEIEIEDILYAKNIVINQEKQMFIVVYKCKYLSGEVRLSEEHIDFKWVSKDGLREIISPSIRRDFEENGVFSRI